MKKGAETRRLHMKQSIAQFGDQIFKRDFLILDDGVIREDCLRRFFFHGIVPPLLFHLYFTPKRDVGQRVAHTVNGKLKAY